MDLYALNAYHSNLSFQKIPNLSRIVEEKCKIFVPVRTISVNIRAFDSACINSARIVPMMNK